MNSETRRTVRNAVATALLVIAVGVGVYYAARTRPAPAPTPAPEQAAAPEATPEPEVSVARPRAPEPKPAMRVKQDDTAEPVAPAVEKLSHDLTGLWQLSVQDDSGNSEPVARVNIKQTTGELTASINPDGGEVEITLSGLKLTLVQKPQPRVQYNFEGMVDPAYTEVNGTFESVFSSTDDAQQDVRDSLAAKLTRVTDEMIEEEKRKNELREGRIREAKAIFEGLRQFAARNNGQFPGTLNQLPATDLPDPELLASAPGRRITYMGSGQGSVNRENVNAVEAEFRDKENSRENLLELERRLREAWGSESPGAGAVLRIEYDDPPFSISVGPSGTLTTNGPETGDPVDANASEALRASEFNNLKQLMLVVKMFQNEHDDFIPGGWLTTYPEYLADVAILHSPWAAEGTVTYDLLFPGAQENDLIELAQSLRESGARGDVAPLAEGAPEQVHNAVLASEVPAIISRELLPASPGQAPARAVAFLDGHVQAVPLSEWDTVVTPFLR